MPHDAAALFERARQALGTTQEELGQRLGVSRRTAQRWAASGIPSYHLPDLARLAHPHDRVLAREIAAAAGITLEAAGIVQPPPPPAPPPPAHPPDSVVDAVVCAAAEAMEIMPKEVRPGLYAAFARAKEIGLTIDVIERALRAKLNVVQPAQLPADAVATTKRKSPRA
jgi:transcriptional regulator with XRE-family HTH domain